MTNADTPQVDVIEYDGDVKENGVSDDVDNDALGDNEDDDGRLSPVLTPNKVSFK